MKVLFIVTTFPAISQTFILNQIVGLIDRGCEVDILASMRGNENETHRDVDKYRLQKKIYYYDEILRPIPKNKLKRLQEFAVLSKNHFLKRPKALIKSLNIFKHGKEAVSLKTFYTTLSFIDRGPYDIVHCHFGPNGKMGIYLKEIGAIEGKVVTTFHGYDLTIHIREKGERTYSEVFKNGDLFMPISFLWKEKLIKLGCSKRKIIVHRMGVDTKKIKPISKKRKFKKSLKLISVARFVEKKGLVYSIRAVAEAAEKCKSISYVIVGDGELKEEYKKQITRLKALNNIKLLGWKNTEEVIEIMENSDILLAPSITSKKGDKEGIPVVLMEAMALGLAVISTIHSGIPELVKDGISGFLVRERSAEEMKNKIMYFEKYPERIVEMGKEGRNIVKKYFEINKLNDKLFQIYKNML